MGETGAGEPDESPFTARYDNGFSRGYYYKLRNHAVHVINHPDHRKIHTGRCVFSVRVYHDRGDQYHIDSV